MADEEEKTYKFNELSKEAKERAIEDWRHDGHDWDSFDSDNLTASFKEILGEKGVDAKDVWWSLGYCQDDGVCFQGSINLPLFLKENKIRGYSGLVGLVAASVSVPNSRYCHYNGMNVTVEPDYHDWTELVPRKTWEAWQDWEVKRDALRRKFSEEVAQVERERTAPIREWHRLKQLAKDNVFGWFPEESKQPEPLKIPYPPEVEALELPERFKQAEERAKNKEEVINVRMNELEKEISEAVKDLSRELEKIGYAEIEYKSSSDVIADILMDNDYDFDEDGEMQ